VTSSETVSPANKSLGEKDSSSKPSVSTFNRVLLTLRSVPSLEILIALTECDGAEAEPENQSTDWVSMLRRNQESIDKEEPSQEMDQQKNLYIGVATPSLVAVENIPFPDAILSVAAEPVITADTKFVHDPETKADSWYVSHANIQDDVIPPALSEVRKDVLPGKFDDLVKQMPEMKNVRVSDHKSGKEPVAQVHEEVVINIVPDVA